MPDLTSLDEHFAFGENWQSFAEFVDEERVRLAVAEMNRLFPNGELEGKTFLDIGCGSGLSSLAALTLGAAKVTATDIDSNSVKATNLLLSRWWPERNWVASVESVFDLPAKHSERYDVVYSWGVLHHTGAMWTAVDCAAKMVKPGGLFAIALYQRTPFCNLWKVEKRIYTHGGTFVQLVLRAVYKAAFFLRRLVAGDNPIRFVESYKHRGMSWSHDVHDWLGGYPYESASPEEVITELDKLSFEIVRTFIMPRCIGLFGSGCDEFVAVKSA